jgi:hypothetical protein
MCHVRRMLGYRLFKAFKEMQSAYQTRHVVCLLCHCRATRSISLEPSCKASSCPRQSTLPCRTLSALCWHALAAGSTQQEPNYVHLVTSQVH